VGVGVGCGAGAQAESRRQKSGMLNATAAILGL
jgi:hypothetical protein